VWERLSFREGRVARGRNSPRPSLSTPAAPGRLWATAPAPVLATRQTTPETGVAAAGCCAVGYHVYLSPSPGCPASGVVTACLGGDVAVGGNPASSASRAVWLAPSAHDDVGSAAAVSVDCGGPSGEMRHLPGVFGWNG
jgi:hypothetical protein